MQDQTKLEDQLRELADLLDSAALTRNEIVEQSGRSLNWVRWRLRYLMERGLIRRNPIKLWDIRDGKPVFFDGHLHQLTPLGQSFVRHQITSLNEPIQ